MKVLLEEGPCTVAANTYHKCSLKFPKYLRPWLDRLYLGKNEMPILLEINRPCFEMTLISEDPKYHCCHSGVRGDQVLVVVLAEV